MHWLIRLCVELTRVKGISGHELKAVAAGSLGPIPGIALVVPGATTNLLSLMAMVKSNGGTFSDREMLIVVSGDDSKQDSFRSQCQVE